MRAANDNHTGLRFLSVCSGIEAASVAWEPLGWKAVAFGEIDKAASRVLAHHYPDTPNLGDFTTIDVKSLPNVDILCGGTPCQAFSVAGARRGLDDARGNLTLAFVGLAHELADNNGLRNAIWENVPGVLTMADNAFGCFLAGLVGADGPFIPVERKPAAGKSSRWWRWAAKEKCHAPKWPKRGMVSGPKGRAAWHLKDAQYFGLAQRRERVLVVADFGNGADPSEVLFERVGVPWHPPARREAREDVAGTISARTQGGGGLGTDFDLDGGLVPKFGLELGNQGSGGNIGWFPADGPSRTLDTGTPPGVAYAPEIARCVATREGSSQDYETTTMVACVTGDITHTLKAEGADASEGGTGRGTPIIAFGAPVQTTGHQGDRIVGEGDIHPALSAQGGNNGGGAGALICFTAKDYGADASLEISPTLRAGGHKDSHQNGGVGPAIAWSIMPQNSGKDYKARPVEVAQPLMAGGHVGGNQGGDFILQSAVRRLTPKECERLQGFPDDYTRIPVKWYATRKITKNRPEDMWEADPKGGWWLMQADGPRYKQLGNSWAVPKFTWLGRRIQAAMPSATQVAEAA